MATQINSRVLWTIQALISVCFCVSGCLEFESIKQPSSVLPSETFMVFIEVTTTEHDNPPYFGVCLPIGWAIQGDAIPYAGISNGTIIYDSDLALEQEGLSPSPEGYYWWVGSGNPVDSEVGSVHGEIQIQTNNQTGRFYLDYMLGGAKPPMGSVLNYQRSNDHFIEVVDEYSPRELKAIVEEDTVSLSWDDPFVSEGLIGYVVYRDGQVINTNPVTDTMFIDKNPSEELHSYTISSLYDNSDVHFLPYEIKVLVFSGGTGDQNNPYQITMPVQLTSFSIADFPLLLDKCFILTNDIDLEPNLPGGHIFDRAVIAPDISDFEDDFQGTAFTGTFDGDGFRISNLTIVGQDHLGLIGTIGHGGNVSNLSAIDANIVSTGSDIGIFTGINRGSVTNCYSTGTIIGTDSVGGLLGSNEGMVSYCYSTSLVSGQNSIGGLVGYNMGQVACCYSTGSVYGEGNVGGLVGWGSYENVSDSFWDMETSGQTQSGGGIGLTTAQMMDPEFFGLNGWSGNPNWILDMSHDYPHLAWEGTHGQYIPETIIEWIDGMGTTDDPYEIVNADQLVMMSKASILWDKHFVLSTDINMTGKIWLIPVIPEFSGTFDGNGFAISHLTIAGKKNTVSNNKFGLFGQLEEGAQILNLGVVDANVVGRDNIGILAGENYGNVINCYSTGTVSSSSNVGGLVGENHGNLSKCYSTSLVSGDYVQIGGLVGNNDGGTVTGCHSTGSVSGRGDLGGLVGRNNDGAVTDCYSTGKVIGTGDEIGGLVGFNRQSNITGSFGTGTVSGTRMVGGLVGFNYEGSIAMSYSTGAVSGEWKVGGLVGDNGNGSNIIHCCSTGEVRGAGDGVRASRLVGGLVGQNSGGLAHCYATGMVSGGERIGGLAGGSYGFYEPEESEGIVAYCYSTGAVSGYSDVGGLVGDGRLSHLANCFWDTQTSGQTKSSGGTGKTTTEMQTATTFLEAGWDFMGEIENGTEDIWWIPEGRGVRAYPRLWWELVPEN